MGVAVDPSPLRETLLLLRVRSEEHTSELQSRLHLVCRLLLEKKKSAHIHPIVIAWYTFPPLTATPPKRSPPALNSHITCPINEPRANTSPLWKSFPADPITSP